MLAKSAIFGLCHLPGVLLVWFGLFFSYSKMFALCFCHTACFEGCLWLSVPDDKPLILKCDIDLNFLQESVIGVIGSLLWFPFMAALEAAKM